MAFIIPCSLMMMVWKQFVWSSKDVELLLIVVDHSSQTVNRSHTHDANNADFDVKLCPSSIFKHKDRVFTNLYLSQILEI